MKRTAVVLAAALAVVLSGCSSSPAPSPTVTVYETVAPVADPTPAETTAAAAPETVVLTEEQRATMDRTFGRELGENSLLGTYCPMDTSGRAYYAELIASQLDGFSEAMVMQYLAEVC